MQRLQNFVKHKSPYTIFAAVLIPNVYKASQVTARNQNLINQARVACALERYRLANGSYPDALDALAPGFIEKLPHDIINGGPLIYRKTDNSFVLYSIGWNEKDDGGIAAKTKEGQPDWDNGDWVWSYSAK
jgi:type II secretory pathway pseudopilin PulG